VAVVVAVYQQPVQILMAKVKMAAQVAVAVKLHIREEVLVVVMETPHQHLPFKGMTVVLR
jgi:hypothetical protein